MCHINYPNQHGTIGFGSTGTVYIHTNDQKKKDLITRLLKNDLITLDDALLLLDKLPEQSSITFGSTTTNMAPFTNTTYTNLTGLDKDLIN